MVEPDVLYVSNERARIVTTPNVKGAPDLVIEVLSDSTRRKDEIKKRKLEAPAIMLFEMHKPISYIGSQAAIVFSPFIVPFVGFDAVNNYSRLFSKRQNVERLLQVLETQENPEA